MSYNNVKVTGKYRITEVTMDVKWHGSDEKERKTLYWRLHAMDGQVFVLFESDNPISSWRAVKDAGLADEFESFREEYIDLPVEQQSLGEPRWEVDWTIQVVPDQLKPKYMRIVDIRETGNGLG